MMWVDLDLIENIKMIENILHRYSIAMLQMKNVINSKSVTDFDFK